MLDWAVVGGGIGGVFLGAFLSKESKNGALFEKLDYLGGCAGAFCRDGFRFNVGATTIMGYEKGMPLFVVLENLKIKPNLKELRKSMQILYKNHKIDRFYDFESFLDSLNNTFYHKNNRIFWQKVKEVADSFWSDWSFYYSKANWFESFKSAHSLSKFFKKFAPYLLFSAYHFINKYLPNIDRDYLLFLDEQIRIVAQSDSKNVNFLVGALALSYSLYPTYYSFGGVGAFMHQIGSKVSNISLNNEVLKIIPKKTHIELHTKKDMISTKKLYLNLTVFDVNSLFDTSILELKRDYKKVGAFIVYLVVKSDANFEHHYQILLQKELTFIKSHSLFVSFSDKNDNSMAKAGYYSVTISTHTPIDIWLNLSKEHYLEQKEILLNEILMIFKSYFQDVEIIKSFCATPKSFKRYINRVSVGGIPLLKDYFFLNYPASNTKDKRIYLIGDTIFPGQGILGVVMGAMNCYSISQKGFSFSLFS